MKKKTLIVSGSMLVAAAMMLPSTAMAAPDKPMNAAATDSGLSCWVHAAEGAGYLTDPDCSWHNVTKSDKEGNVISFRYQDKGTLREGQAAPDSTVRIPISASGAAFGYPGLAACTGTEVVTPSGNYSSNLTCK